MARRLAVLLSVLAILSGEARAAMRVRPLAGHGIADARAEIVFSDLASGRARDLLTAIRAPQSVAANRPPPAPSATTQSPAQAERATARSPVQRTGSAQVPSPGPQTSFFALGDDAHTIPPDTNGAVGPSHVLTALNSQVRIHSRSGTSMSTVTLSSFWSALGATDPFDPRTRYDPYRSRWIMTSAAGGSGTDGAILVAVSKTSDPTGGWYMWRVNAPGGTWADYPTVGFNGTWIVVQANILTTSSSNFDHSRIWAFGKSALYGGGLGAYAVFQDPLGATQFPVTTFNSTLSTMYLVENWAGDLGGSGALRVSTITGSVGAETYNGGVIYPMASAPWADGPIGDADLGPQKGSSSKINLSDARIQSAVWRNGTIWATHTVFLPSASPTHAAVQWWQIGVRGDIIQRGRVEDASGAISYAYPSMAVNKNNDILLGYSRFSPSEYASANYSLRSGNDALNTMRSDVVLKAGEAPYYKTHSTTENRWGDFSAAAVDPADDISLWTLQQYSWTSNRWATWWGKIQPPAPSGSPLMLITPSPLAFEARLINTTSPTKQATVKNDGSAPLTVTGVSLGGSNASEFTKSTDCTGQQLWPGMSCLIDVTFRPASAGTRTATLTVTSTAVGSPHSIQLSGTGILDATAPVSQFTTQNGALSLGFPGQVLGRSTDDFTGVASVTVRWVSANWTQQQSAGLTCSSGNLSCTWSSSNPLVPGTYTVRAWAIDAVGNAESPGPSIVITVI